MPATLQIDEMNGGGSGGSYTYAVSNLNPGNVDRPNIVPGPTTALLAGQNSFVKYNLGNFTAFNDAHVVYGFRFWIPNCTLSIMTTANAAAYSSPPYTLAYSTPTTDTLASSYAMPTEDPATGIVGINGYTAPNWDTVPTQGYLVVSNGPSKTDMWAWQVSTALTDRGAFSGLQFMFAWEEF